MKRIIFYLLIIICLASVTACRDDNHSDTGADNTGSQNTSDTNVKHPDDSTGNEHYCEYNASIEVISPGCETDGYTLRTCTCGKTVKDQITTATGHTWGAWEIETEPTDASGGVIKRTCTSSHYETAEIPHFNLVDYIIEAIDGGEITARCDSPELVYYIYIHSFENGNTAQTQELRLTAEYLPDHTYSDKYLYSSENHYKQCDVCLSFTKDTEEHHTMVRGECHICKFIPSNVSYSEEAYGLAVSYNANENKAVIPEFYSGPDIEHVGKKIKGIKSFQSNDLLCNVTIPASVEYIEPFAFEGCTSLEKIYFSADIGKWCGIHFGATSNPLNYATTLYTLNDYGGYSKVTEIVLPDTLVEISGSAFEGLKSVSVLKIPKSVKIFGNDLNSVFSSDIKIGKVFYDGDYTDWCSIVIQARFSNPMQFTNNFYMTDDSGSYYQPTEFIIPSEISKIGNYQFIGYNPLSRLIINSDLTYIGDYAFFGCAALKSVDISRGCSLIGSYAFGNCGLLSDLLLPSNLDKIKDFTFDNCLNMECVYFKGGWSEWCNITFSNASSNPMHINMNKTHQTAVEFYYLYKNDYQLANSESVLIADDIKSIGDYQFYGFNTISQIILPDGLESLGAEAFSYCSNLNAIVIPKTVKNIKKNLIKGLNESVSIYFSGTDDEWDLISIDAQNADLISAKRYYYAKDEASLLPSFDCWAYNTDGSIARWLWDSLNEKWYLEF